MNIHQNMRKMKARVIRATYMSPKADRKKKSNKKSNSNKPIYWLFFFLINLTLLNQPNIIQAQPIDLAKNANTPCVADFEDFLSFSVFFRFNEFQFYPIFDVNGDDVINLSDFFLFRDHFNKPICIPLDSLAILNRISIEQLKTETFPTKNTRLTLPFLVPIRLANAYNNQSGLSIKTPIIDLITGESIFYNIPLVPQTAQADTNLQIETDGMIANGSILSADLWALGIKDVYQSPHGDLTLPSPFSPAQATLALRPFSPTNINFFTSGVYLDATAMIPASDDTLTEATALTGLDVFLAKRITNADSLQIAHDAFSHALLVQKMPNPTLRAGLISLFGTLGEPAIGAITHGPLGPITFGTVPTGDYATVSPDRSVIIDQRYQSEAFSLFGPIFTRLSLQIDTQTGRNEELTTSALLALVVMQQALTDSAVVQSGTELSRRLNTQMLARLNSGRAAFPNIGIEQIPDGEVFPNGQSVASYAAVFASLPDDITPAIGLLQTYLIRLASSNTSVPNAQTFNADVTTFLDQHQAVLSPDELIRIARILKLKGNTP